MKIAETRTLLSRDRFVPIVEWLVECALQLGKMILLVAFLTLAGWWVMLATAK